MTPLLEHWLGQAYKARVVERRPPNEIHQTIRDRLAADQNLMAEAKAELARLEAVHGHAFGELWKRDYVGSVHRDTLIAVLHP